MKEVIIFSIYMIKNNILVDEHYSIYHIENEVFIACFTIIAHQGGNQEHLFLSWYENINIDLNSYVSSS